MPRASQNAAQHSSPEEYDAADVWIDALMSRWPYGTSSAGLPSQSNRSINLASCIRVRKVVLSQAAAIFSSLLYSSMTLASTHPLRRFSGKDHDRESHQFCMPSAGRWVAGMGAQPERESTEFSKSRLAPAREIEEFLKRREISLKPERESTEFSKTRLTPAREI